MWQEFPLEITAYTVIGTSGDFFKFENVNKCSVEFSITIGNWSFRSYSCSDPRFFRPIHCPSGRFILGLYGLILGVGPFGLIGVGPYSPLHFSFL